MSIKPEPQHHVIAEFLKQLDEQQREAFEERAGILEFDAGLTRSDAEASAMLEIIRIYGLPFSLPSEPEN